MKQKLKKIICILAVVVVLCAVVFLADSQLRVKTFVLLHGQQITESFKEYGSVPAGIGYKYFNLWIGHHDMLEFILFTRGNTYFGCYYSFDDVPLAFQNIETEVAAAGKGWSWKAEGDNHGFTQRIAPGWFYFEAAF